MGLIKNTKEFSFTDIVCFGSIRVIGLELMSNLRHVSFRLRLIESQKRRVISSGARNYNDTTTINGSVLCSLSQHNCNHNVIFAGK